MIEQYRLRLQDGTVLTVDHAGLRPWLMDERAMVQPPGSQRWRPLKKFLAEQPTAPVPPRVETAPSRPAPEPSPPAPAALRVEPLPPRIEPSVATPNPRPTLSPLAESTGPARVRRDDGIPIIPFKPLDDDRPARGRAAVAAPSLYEVALAEVERHGGTDAPWQWTPPKARPVPIAEEAAPERPARAKDEPVAISRWQEEPVAIKLAPPDPRDEEARLEELDLVEDVEDGPPPPTLPEVLGQIGTRGQGLVQEILRRGRALAPPSARWRGLARTWAPRALPAMGAMAVLVIVVATRATWMGVLFAPRAVQRVAPPAPPAPATPEPSPLPREVQAAIAQLPHLSTDVVQLVIAHGGPALPDPPEVFRRAWVAANRGASALSETDAEELRSTKKAVLFSLRPAERDRVRAYDRVSVSVDLLVLEDGKVMALFTRGVRALSPARRERLQALLGKAITSALAPPVVEARR